MKKIFLIYKINIYLNCYYERLCALLLLLRGIWIIKNTFQKNFLKRWNRFVKKLIFNLSALFEISPNNIYHNLLERIHEFMYHFNTSLMS